MRGFTFLIFAILTICCWGLYGPVLHIGQEQMGQPGQKATLRPFIGVGVAYFLIAVIFPLIVLLTKKEKGCWTASGSFWSFFAGAVGAIGAMGIIMAFKFKGKPFYVMPLVFGCAPVVNTFVTMFMARTFKNASALFFVGVLIVATGAAGVLIFKPKENKPAAPVATQTETADSGDETSGTGETSSETESTVSGTRTSPEPDSDPQRPLLIALSIAATALCWGAYGPVLHKGQARMEGSRLRPFLCVGLAYFAIAVVLPWFLLGTFPEGPGQQPTSGFIWSILAGAAGAIGALGIIYAFNFGGKPIYVMPLVFGFAPVVNTLAEALTKNLLGQIGWQFYLSLLLVILGAVMVLVCAPRGKKPEPTK